MNGVFEVRCTFNIVDTLDNLKAVLSGIEAGEDINPTWKKVEAGEFGWRSLRIIISICQKKNWHFDGIHEESHALYCHQSLFSIKKAKLPASPMVSLGGLAEDATW